MISKLVLGRIDPRQLDAAAMAVDREFIPLLIAKPGALQGYWMANRSTGEIMAMTTWSTYEAMDAARNEDGAERARIYDRIGVRIGITLTMTVVAASHGDTEAEPVIRWARLTWVEGMKQERVPELVRSYGKVLPDQVLSSGFCGSYWLADMPNGNGLALSLWEGPQELRRSEHASRRRRNRLAKEHGFRVDCVGQYEALGVGLHGISVGAPDLADAQVVGADRS
jgi:hypothetical protein